MYNRNTDNLWNYANIWNIYIQLYKYNIQYTHFKHLTYEVVIHAYCVLLLTLIYSKCLFLVMAFNGQTTILDYF